MTPTNNPSSSAREWNSDVYHRLSGPQVSWGKKVLSRLRLRGDEVVLDAGCGTGRLTAELLAALPRGRVVGVDLSQNMLGSAREHLAQFGTRVSLVACDLLHLPFDPGFDCVVSTAAFHWVLDHDQLFANLRRVLVPGGRLEAQCGGGPNLVRLRNRANALTATAKFAQFFTGFPRALALSICGECGGRVAACGIRGSRDFDRSRANGARSRRAVRGICAQHYFVAAFEEHSNG